MTLINFLWAHFQVEEEVEDPLIHIRWSLFVCPPPVQLSTETGVVEDGSLIKWFRPECEFYAKP